MLSSIGSSQNQLLVPARAKTDKEHQLMQNTNALAIPEQMAEQGYGQLSGLAKYQAKKDVALATKRTMVAIAQEQGRTMLTQLALESVAALTSFEEHLCEVAPSGANRYRHIVDAYAMGVANRIAKW
jgi:hypothetical protein